MPELSRRHHRRIEAKVQYVEIFKQRSLNKFNRCYLAAVKNIMRQLRLDKQYSTLKRIKSIDFATEFVAPSNFNNVIYGKYFPATTISCARVVIYRAPIQQRVQSSVELYELVESVILETIST